MIRSSGTLFVETNRIGSPLHGGSGALESDPVREFIAYVDGSDLEERILRRGFVAGALKRLSLAMATMAAKARISGVQAPIELIRSRSEQLEGAPPSLKHAEMVRDSFIAAARVMTTVQQAHFPKLADQLMKLRQAAEAIRLEKPLVAQRNLIASFLAQLSLALYDMHV